LKGEKMKTKWLVLLLIALFVATGCSSMSKRTKCASVGAATGAAVGATAGGIFGHNKGGAHLRTEYAVIGGGVGAVIGGVAGYLICEDEPAPAPPVEEPAPPAPAPKPAPAKIILNGVQFDFDKAVIKAEYYPVLDAAVSALKQQGDKKVMITGYTCSMGPEAYNQKLSEKRAAAVKAYLVDKGISASRLMTSGGGESNPVADNKTKAGRMMNRRAELVVIN
jgi:outer membrane protein OmpA-like peptidoglycan-associated protein